MQAQARAAFMSDNSNSHLDRNGQMTLFGDYPVRVSRVTAHCDDDSLRVRALELADLPKDEISLRLLIKDIKAKLELPPGDIRVFEKAFFDGIRMLYSAQQGTSVGFGFSNLMQVAKFMEHSSPQFMGAFLLLCRKHKHTEDLSSNNNPTWYRDRVQDMKNPATSSRFTMEADLKKAFVFLFPELGS